MYVFSYGDWGDDNNAKDLSLINVMYLFFTMYR